MNGHKRNLFEAKSFTCNEYLLFSLAFFLFSFVGANSGRPPSKRNIRFYIIDPILSHFILVVRTYWCRCFLRTGVNALFILLPMTMCFNAPNSNVVVVNIWCCWRVVAFLICSSLFAPKVASKTNFTLLMSSKVWRPQHGKNAVSVNRQDVH